MNVLVIGGTGYIGSAVVRRLESSGHSPVVLVRQGEKAPAGLRSTRGDLTDPASLRQAVAQNIDAVVHAATPTGDWEVDAAAIRALIGALAGRRLVYLSGVWVLGATLAATETSPVRPVSIVSGRPALEDLVLSSADGVVVRPGIVHGGGGIPALMVGWARDAGVGRFVGDSTVHWPMVHRDDLADLVVLALEPAAAGTVLHGVAEPAVPVVELAAAAHIAAGGDGATRAWPVDEAAPVLGEAFAEALGLSRHVLAPASRALGWSPRRPGAVADLIDGGGTGDEPGMPAAVGRS